MASLERTLRKDLESAVRKARNVAEAGARQAIAQLGVGEAEAPRHLTAGQRALRNRLRAHGRQLGDRRDPKTGAQVTARLAQECAYEHWHRMLFARFLGETDLLIEPESGVAIALEEVQELAREQGTDWLPLASDYAERMLPQIFRKDDPVLDIALPPETRSELEELLKALPKAVFETDDSLGWVYQFWQAEKKDEVNKSEVKIGADELPAVTQLFTEDYMVLFLLHNTLGAWWAGKVLAGNPALPASATNEDALRAACRVGSVDWTYLRFVRDKTEDGAEGPWRPAAGTFDRWPKAAKNITMLDPCMGSGHFLVFALPILVAFRMAEEGLSERDAIDAVLRDNLFGLEIDPRCTQIAAFNLAFAAWKRTGFHVLPHLNLASSGLAIGVAKADWLKLAEKAVTAADPATNSDLLVVEKNLLTVGLEERVKNGLEALYDLFAKAPWLGSLIDPRRAGADIFREGFDKLAPLLAAITAAADTDDAREMAVAAQGMAKAASILSRYFVLVSTNVPYLGRNKQHEVIKGFCDLIYPAGRADIATCFMERCVTFCKRSGAVALVTPQNWLFLSRYKVLRGQLLKQCQWDFVIRLGEHAFESSHAAGAFAALIGISASSPPYRHSFVGIEASNAPSAVEKSAELIAGSPIAIAQLDQFENPDHAVGFSSVEESKLLGEFASSVQGFGTSDNAPFIRAFWELPRVERGWVFAQSASESTKLYAGRHNILLWEGGKGQYFQHAMRLKEAGRLGGWRSGGEAWGKLGISISEMREMHCTMFTGEMFDNTAHAIIPNDAAHVLPIWEFLSSGELLKLLRETHKGLKVSNHAVLNVPFDLARWQRAAAEKYPEGLPAPFTRDPAQWLFQGSPEDADKPLQVSVARLLGYQWPRQTGSSFVNCPELKANNLRDYIDGDGIVCLTALKGEPPAEQRLNALLAEAFGADWSAAKLAGLLAEVWLSGKTLHDWLRDGFFEQHCELFHQRPFIWHIWDGRRDGFHALVNYHRLAASNGEGRRTLEKLIYSYLGDWIDRQRAEQKAGVEGADAHLAHAEHLRAELIKVLEGEPPYDIFVRWKPLHAQPIGWDPDINDGVRMNIRPFMTARPLSAKTRGASILRATPKIKWDKDRGKEPNRDKADYPWFWGWDEASPDFSGRATFDGNRWNDLHYSRAVKQAARDRQAGKAGAKP